MCLLLSIRIKDAEGVIWLHVLGLLGLMDKLLKVVF